MKKIIVLLTTIISINLFGGVLHPDVDMRVIGKIGIEKLMFLKVKSNFEIDTQIKGNVYKSDEFNVYLGGKGNIKLSLNEYFVDSHLVEFATTPSIFLGFEEYFKELKIYQQLEMGVGYMYSEKSDAINRLLVTPALQLGVNYKNILFTIDIKEEFHFLNKNRKQSNTIFQLGLGYEF